MAATHRTISGTTTGLFALTALAWAASLLEIGPIGLAAGWALHHPLAGLLATTACWTASGALVLTRPVADRLGHLLFPIRRPHHAELARIIPAWQRVCALAATDPRRYLLRVETSDRLNAFAMGGHLVAVTQTALDLPDDMLDAVLAHELGHHHALHPTATILGWWYLTPFLATQRCLRAATRAAAALLRGYAALRAYAARVTGGGAPIHGALGILGILAALALLLTATTALAIALLAIWLPLAILTRASLILFGALSRAGEYAADRYAVQLGLGPGLARVLELFDTHERAKPPPRGLARLTRTHPPCRARINAVHTTPTPRTTPA